MHLVDQEIVREPRTIFRVAIDPSDTTSPQNKTRTDHQELKRSRVESKLTAESTVESTAKSTGATELNAESTVESTAEAAFLSPECKISLSRHLLCDTGPFSIHAASSPVIREPIAVKTPKWPDADLHRSLHHESAMLALLNHDRIVKSHGLLPGAQPMLVLKKYDADLSRTLVECHKPSKARRISMAHDVLDGLAWMHALNYAHNALDL